MLFKGYFKAALVLSFTLMGTGAALPKPGTAKNAPCQLESKTGCPCRDAEGRREET